jgi:CelD/BcsL family acetyltransferase involved in cellulose biosynthesis
MSAVLLQEKCATRIEVVEQADRFADLRREWNDLLRASSSNCLFLTWEWLYTWWKHLAEGQRLFLLLVRSGEELLAIAPMELKPNRLARLFPLQSLEFLGTGSVGSDYLDLIVRRGMERHVLELLCDFLSGEKFMIKLAQVNRDSSLAAKLAQGLQERGWSHSQTMTNVCPFIDLSGHTWQSYLSTLGAAHRYNVQRRLRQWEKKGGMQFELSQTDPQRHHALETLFTLHRMRWRDRGGSDGLHTEKLLAFHREFSGIALERDWLRLFTLRLGEEPAASLYGFRYGRSFNFYQSGLDSAFGKLSAGLVTMGLTIKSALEEGAGEFDLLHGDEDYKFLWARQTRELCRFELYPPCISSLLYKRAVGFGRMAKRWYGTYVRPPRLPHPRPISNEIQG